MSFLVYDSVILRLTDQLAPFDTYTPPSAYTIDSKARRWCRQHAPPAARLADPQDACLPRCTVCGRLLRGVMNEHAAKAEITLFIEIDIDAQPATIYAIITALEQAVSWQEEIWLLAATSVGETLLGRLQ